MKKQKELTYNSFETQAGNTIWTPSMSLVWSEIISSFHLQQPIQLYKPPKNAQKLIKILNNSTINKEILPEDGFYIKCGFGQKTISQINKNLKKKFKNKTFELKQQINQTDFISYTYLTKSLTFLNKFQFRRDKSFRFNDRPVQSFYAKYFQQKQQIKCFFYENPKNFLIQIRLKQSKSQLYLIKSEKINSTDQAINTVISSIAIKGAFSLSKKDKFQMPFVNIRCIKKYEAMEGLRFKNKELTGYAIKKMYEEIRFEINECGAILESQAALISFKSPSIRTEQPKQFYLDQSFWLVLKEENHHPYYCVYVSNTHEIEGH